MGGGLWYLQSRWDSKDPANAEVLPDVEKRIWSLLETSRTANSTEKIRIIEQIVSLGQDGVPVLVQALQDEDSGIRAFAVNTLTFFDDLSVVPHIETRLQDEVPFVRRSAVMALGQLGAYESVPSLVIMLNDGDEMTRCEAARALTTLGGEGAVEPLIGMLEGDPYPSARQTAANALGEIGSKKAVRPLIISLEDESQLVRAAALVALRRITAVDLGPDIKGWLVWLSENPHIPHPR